MLTPEENDLLCRVEGDAADGRADAPALDSRLPVRGSRRARRRRRCACACSARTWSPSATATGGSAWSTSTARTGARRSRSDATKNAVCAASTTAGRSTSRATSSTCPRSRAKAASRKKFATRRIRAARRAASSGSGWVRPETMRDFEPPAWAPSPAVRTSIVKIHVGCNWAQVLEGAIDSAHSSSLHSTDMPPARVDGAKATATRVAAAVDRQGAPACRCSRPTSAFATSRSAARSRTPARTTTCASPCSSRRSPC